jgi:1-acyl-sn-glycerol-3-phosphate acyltransferase
MSAFMMNRIRFEDTTGAFSGLSALPHVVSPNHVGFTDVPVVGLVYEHFNQGTVRPHYITFAEPFANHFGAYTAGHLGGIPLDRLAAQAGDVGVNKKLLEMSKYVLRDSPLVVFPDGTFEARRTHETIFHGSARIARMAKVPLVAMGLDGTEHALRNFLISGGLIGVEASVVIEDVFMPEEKVTPEKLQETMRRARAHARELNNR